MSINCIITGGTDGIGKQTAIELAQLGYKIGIVGRNKEKGEKTKKEIEVYTGNNSLYYFNCDLSVIRNIKNLSYDIKNEFGYIDILINNAGAYFSKYQKTSENLEKTFALNHLSYFALTHHLIDILGLDKPSRVINVASRAHYQAKLDIDDLQMVNKYMGWTAYCNSKLMNILFTFEAHRRYKEENISFNCLHPGFVNTCFGDENEGFGKNILQIGKKLIGVNVKMGAKTSIYLASSKNVSKISGKYFYKSKVSKYSKISHLDLY